MGSLPAAIGRLYPASSLLWLCLALGCERAPPQPPAPEDARNAAPSKDDHVAVDLSALSLSSAQSFDLAATDSGAVIALAQRGCAGAVQVIRLDDSGRSLALPLQTLDACRGEPDEFRSAAEVVELVVSAGGGRLGLAWVAEAARTGRAVVMASHGHADAGALAAPRRLSYTVPADQAAARGRVELAGTESGAQLLGYRTPSGPCHAHAADECAHYVARRHPGGQAELDRGIETREVPYACPRMLLGSLWRDGTWYDAVCSGKPRQTTVFIIRPEISYAEAVEALPGCEPLAVTPAEPGVLLWAQCSDGLAVRRISPGGSHDLELRGVTRQALCRDGRPLLRVVHERQPLELPIRAPVSRLEQMLPPELAPQGARAVWTGERLLVAAPQVTAGETQLALSAYRCRGDVLEPATEP